MNLLSGIDLFFSPKEFFDLNRFSHPLKHSFEIATKSEDESKVFYDTLSIFKQFIVCLESCGGKSCSLEEKVLIANVELIFVSSKPH